MTTVTQGTLGLLYTKLEGTLPAVGKGRGRWLWR